MATVTSGVQRFSRRVQLDDYYAPYPFQNSFHSSPKKHRLLGGAAGPGKTIGLIMDHLVACSEFAPSEAQQVKTLLLRRTEKKLRATLLARAEEKIPRELYRTFNKSMGAAKIVWLNGAETWFGSMQYEHDVWGWQGQWLKIGYDELTEFTFKQWASTAAWNRCPVSPYATKDGATNPIGVGAKWVRSIFVHGKPAKEMEENQRRIYRAEDYGYFPATYLDNPIYANDPEFAANIRRSYSARVAEALLTGAWEVGGGYFEGAWDEAYDVYPAESVVVRPHWRKWLSGDWGFEHDSAIYKHCMDDQGIVRTYGELVVNHLDAEALGERIAKWCVDVDGKPEKFEGFAFSHDAFASHREGHSINSVAERVGLVMAKYGLPYPVISTRDALGREQLTYEMLAKRVKVGVTRNEAGEQVAKLVGAWQIADTCPQLIDTIQIAPRDEDDVERVAEFLGDDPLQGAGYGLYWLFGGPSQKPRELRIQEKLEQRLGYPAEQAKPEQYTNVMMQRAIVEQSERRADRPLRISRRRR